MFQLEERENQGRVVILDLSPYYFTRLYHASKGCNQLQEEGVAQSVALLVNAFGNGDHVSVVAATEDPFSSHRWQSDLYNKYRPKVMSMTDDELKFMDIGIKNISAMGIPVVSTHACESDDVAAGTVGLLRSNGAEEVVLITADPELYALIDEGIRVFNPFDRKERTRDWVVKKYGVQAQQLPDYFALVGGSRYAGVHGVGVKSALEILACYGSIEALQKDNIGCNSLRNKVMKNIYEALLCKVIATPNVELFEVKF